MGWAGLGGGRIVFVVGWDEWMNGELSRQRESEKGCWERMRIRIDDSTSSSYHISLLDYSTFFGFILFYLFFGCNRTDPSEK